MGNIITYPIPEHGKIAVNTRYTVRLRPLGTDEWTEIQCWNVRVDMHDVRDSSMAFFDFAGPVEIKITVPIKCFYIYKAAIRPLSRGIVCNFEGDTLTFVLDRPENLSIELNGDRFRNLHLFAGEIETHTYDTDNTVLVDGDFCGAELAAKLSAMPKNRTAVFLPGTHEITDNCFNVPSDTTVLYTGGAVTFGSICCHQVSNVRFLGRGVVYGNINRETEEERVFKLTYSHNITVDGLVFINPPYYTLFIGSSSNVCVRNIKSFSCEGWSDGIDMMSSSDVHISGCFLRNSDDCIAVYGRRWEYEGDARNIRVQNCTLWADVAHPINIGTHGDYQRNGNILEDMVFSDIDILEHHEMQPGYLGCMAINVGDKNLARNITFENIRVEHFEHGKLFDVQVRHNPDYNPVPGAGIENIIFKDITYNGYDAVPSVIAGFDQDRMVRNVEIINLRINGRVIRSLQEGDIVVNEFAEGVNIRA